MSGSTGWTRVRAAFEELVELAPRERQERLDQLEGEDPSLAAEVRRLLSVELEQVFLETPLAEEGRPAATESEEERWVGRRVGGFRLERLLASGGSGIVCEASQEEPRRRVALKLMRTGLGSPEARRRFRYEAELLARLHHPGVAQVYEVGVLEGVVGIETPWIALEFVEDARPITTHAKDEGLSVHDRIRLFLEVLAAIEHGHRRGVLHRDLKPANVLVDGQGRVKVIDYGIGRELEREGEAETELTREGDVVGTVRYMSPEQLAGRRDLIDTRTDVFALGAVLYEMLVDRPAFAGKTGPVVDATAVLGARQLVLPSRARRGLSRELDWILLTALADEPTRRYDSVSAFAADLRRFLAREPLAAGPPGVGYRLRKFVARNRAAVLAGSTIGVAVLVGAFGLARGEWRAIRADERAVDEADKASAMLAFLVEGLSAPSPRADGQDLLMVEFLERSAVRLDGSFPERPELRGWLHLVIGRAFQGLGLFDRAEEQFEYAVDLLEEGEAPADERGKALLDLAMASVRAGRTERAAEVLEGFDELPLPDETMRELAARRSLDEGRIALARGDYDTALELALESSARAAEAHGPRSKAALNAVGFRAAVHLEARRWPQAEEVLREAVDLSEDLHGSEHPTTIQLRGQLAISLAFQGRVADAVAELEILLERQRALLGDDHSETVATRNNLAALLFRAGRIEEAVAQFRVVHEYFARELGPEDPDTLIVLANLAAAEKVSGELDRAEERFRELHAMRSRLLGEGHPKTIGMLYELGDIALRRGDASEAAETFELCLAVTLEHHEETDPLVARFEFELARALIEAGEHEAAAEVAGAALEAFERGERSEGYANPEELRELLESAGG